MIIIFVCVCVQDPKKMSDHVEANQNGDTVQSLHAGETASAIASLAVLAYSTGGCSQEVHTAVTGMGMCVMGASELAQIMVRSSNRKQDKKVWWYGIGWSAISMSMLISGVYLLSTVSGTKKTNVCKSSLK